MVDETIIPASTASKILSAARCLLVEEGTDAVTMRRVAHATGITAMAIYRHFPNREGLLNALANEGFTELAAQLTERSFSGDIEQRLIQMADIYIDHALHNPRLFELMFLKPRAGARQYPQDFRSGQFPTANLMAQILQEGMDSGYFRADDPWEITFEMGALSHGLIMLYLGGRMDVTPDEFRALYQRSFRRYIHGTRG
ncbi:TetR/AcrR family transcriptional regulator [Acidicapsa dinghuensis]|uniref:TetR/AcrR family transcriptional regulator n=1 Tax=Acidicapsa dinghuensis TaxID=2218256 RepID=A0ABW1EGG2_9BACT|nr:TetR/AcrR family transcriptional regulator [Acidicapsa dinghuensis]